MSDNAVLECLEFAHGAILDAILSEDGLDGDTGLSVIKMIEEQLKKHNVIFVSIDEISKQKEV